MQHRVRSVLTSGQPTQKLQGIHCSWQIGRQQWRSRREVCDPSQPLLCLKVEKWNGSLLLLRAGHSCASPRDPAPGWWWCTLVDSIPLPRSTRFKKSLVDMSSSWRPPPCRQDIKFHSFRLAPKKLARERSGAEVRAVSQENMLSRTSLWATKHCADSYSSLVHTLPSLKRC